MISPHDMVLILSGTLGGLGVYGICHRIADHIEQKRMESSVLMGVLADIEALHEEIDQFGYETYRREGTLQMRKQRKK